MKQYLLFFLFITVFSFAQQQIGQTIGLNTQDEIIIPLFDISEDGNVVAIGDPYYNTNGIEKAGRVRVYRNLAGVWTQIGQNIEGTYIFNQLGGAISLSADGKVLAIGGRSHPSLNTNTYYVQVYRNLLGTWTQIGVDLQGSSNFASSLQQSISLSANGNTMAIGVPETTTSNGANSGTVRIYQNISGTWVQIGQDIDGKIPYGRSGSSVSLSSIGNAFAFSSHTDDDGYVSVYHKDKSGNWTQLGSDFHFTGREIWTSSSANLSISLSSVTENYIILAIGCNYCPNNSQITPSRGNVQIYSYLPATGWVQIGQSITEPYPFGYFGSHVSLSGNGKRVAIMDKNAILNGQQQDGFVQVYQNNSGTWFQIGSTIAYPGNEQISNETGAMLSSNGDILAVGLRDIYTVPGTTNSYVRVYDMTKPMSSDSFVLNNLNIYPNPTRDVLNISLENNLILEKVIIYNNLGQVIKETSEESFNTSTLASGIYYVEIHTNEGKATKKVVVK